MKKKIIILVGFLVLIVSLCFYGYFSNIDSDADNVISFNEFIKSDVIENNSKIIYEGKGINTVVYKGGYNEKNGIFMTISSDDSIFNNKYVIIDAAEINLVFPDGSKERCSNESIDNRVVYVSEPAGDYNIDECKIDYKLKLHLYIDGEKIGKITLNKSQVETFTPTSVTLFDNVSYMINSISLKENTSNKKHYDMMVNVSLLHPTYDDICYIINSIPTEENTSNNNNYDIMNISLHHTIDSDISQIGQSVYASCDGEEKKLTDTGDGMYTGIIPMNFKEISIRFAIPNIYATCSGMIDYSSLA